MIRTFYLFFIHFPVLTTYDTYFTSNNNSSNYDSCRSVAGGDVTSRTGVGQCCIRLHDDPGQWEPVKAADSPNENFPLSGIRADVESGDVEVFKPV